MASTVTYYLLIDIRLMYHSFASHFSMRFYCDTSFMLVAVSVTAQYCTCFFILFLSGPSLPCDSARGRGIEVLLYVVIVILSIHVNDSTNTDHRLSCPLGAHGGGSYSDAVWCPSWILGSQSCAARFFQDNARTVWNQEDISYTEHTSSQVPYIVSVYFMSFSFLELSWSQAKLRNILSLKRCSSVLKSALKCLNICLS